MDDYNHGWYNNYYHQQQIPQIEQHQPSNNYVYNQPNYEYHQNHNHNYHQEQQGHYQSPIFQHRPQQQTNYHQQQDYLYRFSLQVNSILSKNCRIC